MSSNKFSLIISEDITSYRSDRFVDLYAAILGKAAQGVFNFRAQCCQQDRQSGIGCNTNVCIDMCNAYSLRRKKFAWAGLSVMKLSTLTINMNGMENRASVRCTGLF